MKREEELTRNNKNKDYFAQNGLEKPRGQKKRKEKKAERENMKMSS